MIETLSASNGSLILRAGGRLLASAVNPESEAHAWLARRKELLDQVKFVLVLGAGAGYHIDALTAHTEAQVVVIDASHEVIAAVRKIHAFDSRQVQLVTVENIKELRSHSVVRGAMANSFVVLQHAPSVAGDPDFYQEIYSQLVGRDWGALNWQWQLKGFAPLESQPRIDGRGEALTIFDLEQTELVQDSQERERMLIKALRELVK